jgi:ESX secretion-associated protein EspG
MESPDYALSNYEFDVLWGQQSSGRIPYPLGAPRTGWPREQRAVLTDEVYRGLIARGLVDTARRLDAGLAEFLRLLDRHHVSVDLVGDFGYPVCALAVTDGRDAALAVRAGGELWLNRIRPGELVSAAVGLLPHVTPAVPAAGGTSAVPEPSGRDPAPWSGSASHCLVAGRFGISTGDGEPVPVLVSWFDLDGVRYLMVREGARLHVGPADHAEIERRVCALLPATG